MNNKLITLSKQLSHALRHEPEYYGLELDKEGWVSLHLLIDAFQKTYPKKWGALTIADIEQAVESGSKKRHELLEGRIRAYYGHSTENKLIKQVCQPPDFLFHGTARNIVAIVLKQGLLPMRRQYVHLSTDKETAVLVGKRKDTNPEILRISAAEAYQQGVKFYLGNESIWLADNVPAKYIVETVA
jgi:putative RNA 2'-phosphotransferase